MNSILRGGFVAGALDIVAAFVTSRLRGVKPVTVLQSISSGLFGSDAFSGGTGTAVLGLALHFFIATTAAAVFYVAARYQPIVARQPFVSGPLYGIVVYLIMNFVVLPLSAIPFTITYTLSSVVTGLLIHMTLVGLPIAWFARSK